jgi:hypothetical protein
MEWLDEPWPKKVQESLKELWKEQKVTRRYDTATLARVSL